MQNEEMKRNPASEENENEDEEEEEEETPENEKTPVTIVTGFLGAGKTTLVNYILKEQRKWKICVVENEFGEVQIDGDLVEENLAAREDIIVMDNGCVCCSVRGDLVRTFSMLNSRRKDFDAIIIETTGLADPSPIVFTFNTNALLHDNFRIDSVVCLIDAKHVGIHLDEVKPDGNINEAERQVAFADRIILNKLDLVSDEELSDVLDRLRSINSFAHLIKTKHSRAPLDEVLGVGSFSLEKMVEVDPLFMEEDEEPAAADDGHVHDEHCGHHVHDEHCDHDSHSHDHEHHDGGSHHGDGHDHDHDHHAEEHDHDHHGEDTHDHHHAHEETVAKKKKKTHNLSLVSSVGFTIEGLLEVPHFNTFMSGLLAAKAADLYRTKGVLAFADQGNTKFVFQGVHEQINFGPACQEWVEGEPRVSKMVFIGKNLDYEYLKENLLACTADPTNSKVVMHKRA